LELLFDNKFKSDIKATKIINDLELQRQTLDFSKISGNTANKDGDMPYKKIRQYDQNQQCFMNET
jgi:hypothetical protein